jgi:hypothetical protein
MIQDIKAPISVFLTYNHRTNLVYPAKLVWDGREYKVQKVGLHYSFKTGKALFHVFTAITETLFFKLVLNTTNLFWTVEQIGDDLPD